MAREIEKFEMKTNFEGLIQLLAQNLYSEPDVFVRELVQNAHDGIVRHKMENENLAGKIEIVIDELKQEIIFSDNGIGMDENDIKNFLSVIGSTGTGTIKKEMAEQGALSHELIGQFGIGMLSAFVVAEKVIVKTKKLGDNKAFAWHNSGSTECILYDDDKKEIGTEIKVHINQEYFFTLKTEYIEKAIKKYCDFIEFPIIVNNHGPINRINAPWHVTRIRTQREKELEYQDYLKTRFSDLILDIIPIEINQPFQARGVLFISDQHNPQISTAGIVDIFIRRMFIRSNDNEFLPPWAKFISGIIESPDLKPTAARDNIQRNDSAYQDLQKKIADLIVDRLAYLAEHEPRKFKRINIWHHHHLKGMALAYEDFFEKVGDLLLFSTNKGMMPLKEYLTKNKRREDHDNRIPIYYFEYSISSSQFYSLAEGKGLTVIDAGRRFEDGLIIKYAELHKNEVFLEKLDSTDDPILFERIARDEEEKYRDLELMFERSLRMSGASFVQVRMRKFEPATLPSVIILTPENEAEGKLKRIVTKLELIGLEEIGLQALEGKQSPIFLSLNVNNPIIQKLPQLILEHQNGEALINILTGIYHSAFMNAQNLIIQHNLDAIHKHYLKILDNLIHLNEEEKKVVLELESERKEILKIRQTQNKSKERRSEHVLLFMMTPFSEQYRIVEDAVRMVFEDGPFYFEVRLARDYTHESNLLDNVRAHMNRAHGFLAEVSEWNPNVMLELGAVLIKPEERPVFALRNKTISVNVPVDINELIFINYDNSEDAMSIASQVRTFFYKDRKVTHEGIHQLLKQRSKHYLSKFLLKSLKTGAALDEADREKITSRYITIEDFVSSDESSLKKLGIEYYLIPGIQGELSKILSQLRNE